MGKRLINMVRATQQLSFGEAFDRQPEYRLFFGIWPDARAASDLTRLMERLRGDGVMSGRPVDRPRLHATLYHLGDFIDQIPLSLLTAARQAAETLAKPPFEVVFDRIGGTRGPFLLRPSNGALPLKSFRKTLSVALINADLGHRIDKAFNPHVTLSYDFSDVREQEIEPVSWTVRQFVLVESLLGKHQHIQRGCWPLQA
jgi:2'-5' RNA ligase